MIGTVTFESLVELVNYYEKHPLYRKICLCRPVNEDVVARIGDVSFFEFFITVEKARKLYMRRKQYFLSWQCSCIESFVDTEPITISL